MLLEESDLRAGGVRPRLVVELAFEAQFVVPGLQRQSQADMMNPGTLDGLRAKGCLPGIALVGQEQGRVVRGGVEQRRGFTQQGSLLGASSSA